MELPGLDFSPGKKFSAEVKARLRCCVSSSVGSSGFLLLIAFGSCKFRLSDASVGVILQSVLGGHSSEFLALELEDRVFQFIVHSQACFEASFFLWNPNGLAAARKATTLHQKQVFQWVPVGARKSYAQAVRSSARSQETSFTGYRYNIRLRVSAVGRDPRSPVGFLIGANRVPINSKQFQRKDSVFDRLVFPCASVSSSSSVQMARSKTFSEQRPQASSFKVTLHLLSLFSGNCQFLSTLCSSPLHRRSPPPAAMAELPRNENLAIVNFHPLTAHQVHFGNVRELVREFLVEFMGVWIREILLCLLGQAYVRFERDYDCDSLVQHSPLPFGDVNLAFSKHNEGWNHRAVLFNRECWLLILNLPADYWKQEHLERIVDPFGHLISSKGEANNLASLVLKVLAEDLESVPIFIPFSVGVVHQGESWTLQCEILQHRLLGNLPTDEEFLPSPDHFGPNRPFDFFGFDPMPEDDLVPMEEVVDLDLSLPPGQDMEEDPPPIIDEPNMFVFDDVAPLVVQVPGLPNPNLEVVIPHMKNPLQNFLVDEVMPDQLIDPEAPPEQVNFSFMHFASDFSVDPGWASYMAKQQTPIFSSQFDSQCPEADRLWRDFLSQQRAFSAAFFVSP
ncbi:hypothetical protein BS78_08G051900 [Paspalum vaginatum]|nr:hypothetical protein BS78_08G051900 [Paspalum vaginatum]